MKVRVVLLMALVLVVGLGAGLVSAAGKTITVGPSGSDYTSIQAAIDAASSGDTIEVQTGTYRENLTVEKSLILRGVISEEEGEEGEEKPVVKGAEPGFPVVLINSDKIIEVTIEGLTIAGAKGYSSERMCAVEDPEWICPHGIQIRGKVKAEIQNVEVLNNADHGIDISGSSQATIVNSRFYDDSVVMKDSSQATIRNNQFYYHVIMTDSSQATIRNNQFYATGVRLFDSSQATIVNNQFSGNDRGCVICLEDEKTSASILHNQIYENVSGIEVYGVQATIANNVLSRNGYSIWISGPLNGTAQVQLQVHILNNQISDNGDGIILVGSTQATILNNQISTNENDGIRMMRSAKAEIKNNVIVDNERYGIALDKRPCYEVDPKFEFKGEVRGSSNEIHGNSEGDVCPSDLQFLMTSGGGCYGEPCD